MAFQDNLAAMPDISSLSGLDVCGENGGVLHHIPAAPGKLGSLKLYNALAERYRSLAEQEPNVIFGGRLAEYKYYDMAPVIEKVMNLFGY